LANRTKQATKELLGLISLGLALVLPSQYFQKSTF